VHEDEKLLTRATGLMPAPAGSYVAYMGAPGLQVAPKALAFVLITTIWMFFIRPLSEMV
jgi:hypothetical protein